MNLPKVGMITFGDPREHEWRTVFSKVAIPRHEQALEFFKQFDMEVFTCGSVACNAKDIEEQAKELKAKGAEIFLGHIPCWTWPNLVVRAAQAMDMPTVLVANDDPGTHATVGLLGGGGALTQVGIDHVRISSDFEGPKKGLFEKKMMPYIKAASAAGRLKGKTFGLFGGRSMGIDTGTFDPMQWKRMFKIDSDHIDHEEIIRRAEVIDEVRIEKMFDWLTSNVKAVNYNEKFTKEKLKYQIACYFATKDIISDRSLDFAAIKCMPDMTNFRIPHCISTAFLNSGYDADGNFEPFAIACEADADAALTMEMMKLLTDGMPTMFADVGHVDYENNLIFLPNCGSMCTWFAGRHCDGCENLKNVELMMANRPTGGAVTYMNPSPGKITLARLCRNTGKYEMIIMEAEFVMPNQGIVDGFKKARGIHQLPVAFVHTDYDIESFMDQFNSNHITAVAGKHAAELVQLCRILGIEAKVMEA